MGILVAAIPAVLSGIMGAAVLILVGSIAAVVLCHL